MEKLYGVFNSEDMLFFVVIDKIDYGGKCCGFTASCRACDKDETFFENRKVFKDSGEIELLERRYYTGNGPEDRRFATILFEYINPETRYVSEGKREVQFQQFFKNFSLIITQNIINHIVHFLFVKRWQIDLGHLAVHAYYRRFTGADMQV